ncbi:PREDICTED: asialoglycoprotein receptor 1-like [Chrysochloris asiatica]|uniref:Asialoglycoprotein receptor 1-like n=1 Tax=Chrysochloris asiatica TaxID=185453 RepID=A0A9B0TN67_CHRAS|nr:PREDICTED: asialoglycoprotein receptor 1-like [Chrysochloris asiatica]
MPPCLSSPATLTPCLKPPDEEDGRFCSGSYLYLFSLGLSLLLFVIICVIGSQISKLRWDLMTLRTMSLNFTSNMTDEIKALKIEAQSLKDKVTTLENKLDTQMQELKADYSSMFPAVQQLVKDLKSLSCHMAALKSNGSQNTCCPINWMEHEDSCYWFSRSGKSWHEAQKYCQLKNAQLVVVTSQEEQDFIQSHTSSMNHWIGLTDENGPWTWVDGTDYQTGFKNWRPEQPDNWYGHGLGGGEDCAHFTDNGRWNDDVCQRPYRWVCETKLNGTS